MAVENFKTPTDDEIKNNINQTPWKDNLHSLYKKLGYEKDDSFSIIKDNWSLIIKDENLEEFCSPVNINNSTLFIKVLNSVAKSEILRCKNEILLNLRSFPLDEKINDILIVKK